MSLFYLTQRLIQKIFNFIKLALPEAPSRLMCYFIRSIPWVYGNDERIRRDSHYALSKQIGQYFAKRFINKNMFWRTVSKIKQFAMHFTRQLNRFTLYLKNCYVTILLVTIETRFTLKRKTGTCHTVFCALLHLILVHTLKCGKLEDFYWFCSSQNVLFDLFF